MKKINYQKGQSLVEVVVALGIAVIIVIAFTSASINSIREAQFAKDQNQATRIAQKTLELVRAIRDQDNEVESDGSTWTYLWSTTLNNGPTQGRCYTLDDEALTMEGTGCSSFVNQEITTREGDTTARTFKRKIRITDDGSDPRIKTIYVQVTWEDGRGTHAAEVNTILTEWQ